MRNTVLVFVLGLAAGTALSLLPRRPPFSWSLAPCLGVLKGESTTKTNWKGDRTCYSDFLCGRHKCCPASQPVRACTLGCTLPDKQGRRGQLHTAYPSCTRETMAGLGWRTSPLLVRGGLLRAVDICRAPVRTCGAASAAPQPLHSWAGTLMQPAAPQVWALTGPACCSAGTTACGAWRSGCRRLLQGLAHRCTGAAPLPFVTASLALNMNPFPRCLHPSLDAAQQAQPTGLPLHAGTTARRCS